MAIFEQTHRHCAECDALVAVKKLHVYPKGCRAGESRIFICTRCAAARLVVERREAIAEKIKSINPPTGTAVQEK